MGLSDNVYNKIFLSDVDADTFLLWWQQNHFGEDLNKHYMPMPKIVEKVTFDDVEEYMKSVKETIGGINSIFEEVT